MSQKHFITFLESLRTPKNNSILEAIHQGYKALHESLDKTYYHGTADYFDKFDLNKYQTIQNGDWGKGIYFDASKSGADYYRRQALRTKSKDYHNAYETFQKDQSSENLEKFRNIGKEIDKSTDGRIIKVTIDPNAKIMKYKAGSITDSYLADEAKSKGFDAVLIDEGNFTEELVVMNPNILIQKENAITEATSIQNKLNMYKLLICTRNPS